jgi:FkbM family methyltransferase
MRIGRIIEKIILKLKIEFRFVQKRFDRSVSYNECINKNHIRRYLPQAPVIIDAGAHVGGDSIEMCRLFPGSVVHAFEPVPAIFERLKYNTRKFDRIHCYQLGLSNQTGVQELHVSSGASDGSSSFLQPKDHLTDHPDVFFEEDITVHAITLDDWAASANINHVDMLWLDMQGYELEVLKASTAILPTVKAIHMEVSLRSTYDGVPLYHELREWMAEQGFRVEVEALPVGWDMGNVLFVRN